MRRLLLMAMLVVASTRGAAQKRNEWSWGPDGEPPKPAEEEKKVTGRSLAAQGDINPPASSITNFDVIAPPHFGSPPTAHVTHVPNAHLVHGPAPGPHPPSVAPVVTGHQLRGEIGPGDGKAEGRFLGIKDKLCEIGLAYDCHKGYKGYHKGLSHHDISYVQPVQVVAVGGPIAAVPVAHKGYGYKGKGYGVPISYPAAPPPPVYHAPPVQPTYGVPQPAYHQPTYGHDVVKHVHTHKHHYNAYSGHSYGKDNSYSPSGSRDIVDKLGGGFGPVPGPRQPTPFPHDGPFASGGQHGHSQHGHSSSSPFLNECQCVEAHHCPPADVIHRRNDIHPHIIGRNKRTHSDADEGKATEGTGVVVKKEKAEDSEDKASRKRRDTVVFEDDKRPERATMVFRETFGGAHLVGPSHGTNRQVFGSSSGGGPCGFGRVCCRSLYFRQQRAINTCGRKSNAVGNLGRVKTNNFQQGDTEFGEYPWHGAILRRESGENVYVCGGALIDSRHLLTAAHCISGMSPNELKVRLGEWDVNGKTEFYHHFDTNVAGIYSHPDFYAGNLQNDVAVIKFQTPVDMLSNPHISPVCLPERFQTYSHQRCFVSGWGKDAFGSRGSFQNRLKEVDLPIVTRRTCQSAFRRTKLGSQFLLHDGMICAGGEEGKDACEGDGGSPLVCQNSDGTVELAGLVSWGLGCGQRGIPGVYTNVPYYMDWISSITRT